MKFLQRQFLLFSQWRYALLALLVLAVLLHCGTAINGGFYADDYLQRSYVIGSEALAQKGFFTGIEIGSFSEFTLKQFLFFHPHEGNYQALLDFGLLPWWMHEDTSLHFYRPLAAAIHYVEYTLFADNPRIMHSISLLWYVVGLWIIFKLYSVVGIRRPIALFALLLLILDNSIFHILPWIAARNMLLIIALGFACVYAYHKGVDDKRWYGMSLLLLLLSLLAGEGGVGICMYLGAYLFTLDTRSWRNRVLAILPFAGVAIVWRLLYQAQGFGAFGADLYIDPGHNPVGFLSRALWQLPGNFFELVAGIDTLSGQVRPDIRSNFAFAGLTLLIALLWLLKPALKDDKALRFFALATLFSLVPGLAVALSSRVMILPNVGLAIGLAYLCYYSAHGFYQGARQWLAYGLIGYTLLMHVLVAFALAAYMTFSIIDITGEATMKRGGVDLGVDDIADKSVVIINAAKPFWTAFLAHELDYAEEALPAHVRVIASSFQALTVVRVGDSVLEVSGDPALQLDSEPVIDLTREPAGHYAYLSQYLMGLTRHRDTPWNKGMQRDFVDMRIDIMELYTLPGNDSKQKPKTLRLTLKQPLDAYRFIYWDMQQSAYRPFDLPALGEQVYIEGIF